MSHSLLRLRGLSPLVRGMSTAAASSPIRIAVVGGGPSGFYTAQYLLKGHEGIHVDIIEKLPSPHGLARYGVAPDHPEVKNCIDAFNATAQHPRCRYMGNVTVGDARPGDVPLSALLSSYSAVVLSYGSATDRRMNVPGESLPGVFSARQFVGWYNGHPECAHLNPDLSTTDTALVVGQGNVALDVARILLAPLEMLRSTDICSYALQALERSTIKKVVLVGRRGPLEIACTIKELREQIKLPGCYTRLHPEDFHFTPEEEAYIETTRPKRRLFELLKKQSTEAKDPSAGKECEFVFNKSPVACIEGPGGRVAALEVEHNRLSGTVGHRSAVGTGQRTTIPGGIVFRSIGYKGISIDSKLPFDERTGIVRNVDGRVEGIKALYCSGWIKNGPTGIIATTMADANATAAVILADIKSGAVLPADPNAKTITDLAPNYFSFESWKHAAELEKLEGQKRGKAAEKLTTVDDMLRIARK